jgi:hypothetical protein
MTRVVLAGVQRTTLSMPLTRSVRVPSPVEEGATLAGRDCPSVAVVVAMMLIVIRRSECLPMRRDSPRVLLTAAVISVLPR